MRRTRSQWERVIANLACSMLMDPDKAHRAWCRGLLKSVTKVFREKYPEKYPKEAT